MLEAQPYSVPNSESLGEQVVDFAKKVAQLPAASQSPKHILESLADQTNPRPPVYEFLLSIRTGTVFEIYFAKRRPLRRFVHYFDGAEATYCHDGESGMITAFDGRYIFEN